LDELSSLLTFRKRGPLEVAAIEAVYKIIKIRSIYC